MNEHYPVIRLCSERGFLEVRDGLVLCFFMRRPHGEVAPAVWRALQTYLRAIHPHTLAWYVDDEGDTVPLDESRWEHIRQRVLESPHYVGCHLELWELEYETGGYNLEYSGRKIDDPLFSHDEGVTCGICFTLPTEYLLEHGAAHVRALALELARELPFSFGYASLAFVAPHARWFSTSIRPQFLPLASRYLGLDMYSVGATSQSIGTRARGAYWLTFLGQPLLGQLGGLERLRQQLPFPDVSFQEMDGERLLLTLGEAPDPIDTQHLPDVPHLRALAHLLEPFLCEENFLVRHILDRHGSYHWLRRLLRWPPPADVLTGPEDG